MRRRAAWLVGTLLGIVLLAAIGPAQAQAPMNDDFDSATVIPALPFQDTLDTSQATTATDDPDCVGNGPTVWYSFTPSESRQVDLNTFGSDYDTTLSVYVGTRGSLLQVACNDDAGSVQSQVILEAIAGTTYYIMIGAYSSGFGGLLQFNASEYVAPPPPANDTLAGATVFSNLLFHDEVDVSGATTEASDPHCSTVSSTANRYTVWYRFTPASDIMVVVNTFGSTYATAVSVYTADGGQITCNTGEGTGNLGRVVFHGRAGESYSILVEADAGGGGLLSLTAVGLPGPLSGGVTVTGGGQWNRTTGKPAGGQVIDTFTVNASRGRRTGVQGSMTWTSVYNSLPGGGGRATSGWPWTIAVDRMFWLKSNYVYVEGVITASPHTPFHEGRRVGFFIIDRGNGVTSPPDLIEGTEILGGNFFIQATR